jgi:hypothetical protein
MLFATQLPLLTPLILARGTNIELREVNNRNSKIPKDQLPVPTCNHYHYVSRRIPVTTMTHYTNSTLVIANFTSSQSLTGYCCTSKTQKQKQKHQN